jgi:hypothetical protein
MSHFIPRFNVTPQRFSDADISAPNFPNLSSEDKLVMGLNQNVLATATAADAILKSSQEQYKDYLNQNSEAIREQRLQAEKQLDATLALASTLTDGLGEINGVKFLKQALKNPDRYKDALENFLNAYNLNKTDYLVSHQIGLIYLYVEEHLDILKAEEFLRRAADYASSDDNKVAAIYYQHLAYSQLLQYQLDSAIKNAKIGFKIDSNLYEIKLIEAECQLLNDESTKACKVVKDICQRDYNNIPIIQYNSVLNKNYDIIEVLTQEVLKLDNVIKNELDKIKNFEPFLGDNFMVVYSEIDNDDISSGVNFFDSLNIESNPEFELIEKFIEYLSLTIHVDDVDEKISRLNLIKKTVSVVSSILNDLKLKYLDSERKPYSGDKLNEIIQLKKDGCLDLAISKHKEFLKEYQDKKIEARLNRKNSAKARFDEKRNEKNWNILLVIAYFIIPHLLIIFNVSVIGFIINILVIFLASKYQETSTSGKKYWTIIGIGGIVNLVFLIIHVIFFV